MRALLLLAALAACNPTLTAQSPSPPGRTARLDPVTGFWGIKSYRMEITQGVALAMSCYYGGPCEKLTVTSDNPEVAEVRQASLGVLERNGLANNATASAVVVVGKAPGTTRLHLHAKEGNREIVVTTVEASPRSQTAAK